MTAKEKANELVNKFRMILMAEDTECGNEILCTLIAKSCALIAVYEILETYKTKDLIYPKEFKLWYKVKNEIEKL